MKREIYFDMDGTLADLYAVENWLPMLRASDPTPYITAAVMHNMSQLARKLNKLQAQGWKIGIVSWLSKSSTPEYDEAVTAAKLHWLETHLRSVKFDHLYIVPYGTSKINLCGGGILFDDEDKNRDEWGENAYHPDMIMEILSSLAA